jgi:ribosomal protein S27E
MPDGDAVFLPLRCPKCDHDGAKPYIGSATVLTVKCRACDHSWSVETKSLSPDICAKVNEALEAAPSHG